MRSFHSASALLIDLLRLSKTVFCLESVGTTSGKGDVLNIKTPEKKNNLWVYQISGSSNQ